jgi:hypothetical protein
MAQSCSNELGKLKATNPSDQTAWSAAYNDVLTCLEEKIDEYSANFDNAANSASRFASEIGKSDNFLTSISDSFTNAYATLGNFVYKLSEQYQLSEQIASTYKKLSANIGIGYENQERLGGSFTDSLALVRELGGDFEDVFRIYDSFAERSGRVRILDDEEVQRIFAIQKSTGLMGDSVTDLAERFDLIGIGSEKFADNINHIMVDSQKMGLNSSKVIKILSDNFESMQRMSFKGGVNAMSQMSKLAVKMRMDVSEMLGMADRFYEPEAAIEAAANLQLLGGEIANSFGDPLQMMFEARNAPEELMTRVGDVTKGLVKFNEQTGQFDLLAENRQKLIGMADALGINKDQLIDTAFQMNKMQKIKMDVGGNLFDDEEKLDKIASLAKFDSDTQRWMVDVGGDSIAVDELDASTLEQALATPTTEKDAAIRTATATMTTNELLKSVVEAGKVRIVGETNIYENTENLLQEFITDTRNFSSQVIDLASDKVKSTPITQDIDPVLEKLRTTLGTLTTTLLVQIKKIQGFNANGTPLVDPDDYTDATMRPVLNSGGRVSSFDPGDEFLVGKSGGPLSGYLAEMNEKLNQTIVTPTIPSVNEPQKMDIGGTLNFGDITISLDGSTETLSFSDSDKKEMMKSIKNEIIKGTTSILSGGYTDGKTSNTNI